MGHLRKKLSIVVFIMIQSRIANASTRTVQKLPDGFASQVAPRNLSGVGDLMATPWTLNTLDKITSAFTKRDHSSSTSWIPSMVKSVKSAFNYIGNAKDLDFGGGGGGGMDGMQSTFFLIAMLVCVVFLLFLLQPLFMMPKRRMGDKRRFRGGGVSQWRGRHFHPDYSGGYLTPSESRPVMLPGPALVPVALPLAGGVTVSSPIPEERYEGQASTYAKGSLSRRPKAADAENSTRGKNIAQYPARGTNPSSNGDDDKLTKEEIMYILKTLDE